MTETTLSTLVIDDDYMNRVRAYPLHTIRDDADLDKAVTVMHSLLDKSDPTPGEKEYLAVLGSLVEEYEREHIALPQVTAVEALHYLMEENGLSQSDVVPLFGGNRSVTSEVLSGKRGFALSHIRRLAAHFNVHADVFIDDTEG